MNITTLRAQLARLKSELAAAEKLVSALEREPLRLWVNVGGRGHPAVYETEAEANSPGNHPDRTRIAVPMVEVRPGYALVKVPTDEELIAAWHSPKRDGNEVGFLRANANALGLRDSLAGVEVEK